MRLIDADALKEKRFRMHSEFLGTVSVVAVRDIDDAPTIDAVPVVHGRWIPKQDGFWKKQILICSICGSRNALNYEFNHCPNCGAKMDEKGAE